MLQKSTSQSDIARSIARRLRRISDSSPAVITTVVPEALAIEIASRMASEQPGISQRYPSITRTRELEIAPRRWSSRWNACSCGGGDQCQAGRERSKGGGRPRWRLVLASRVPG